MIRGVKFLFDEHGHRTGVMIDLRQGRGFWEDILDVAIARSRGSVRQSAVVERPSAIETRSRRIARPIDSERNRTLPSAIANWAPPRW